MSDDMTTKQGMRKTPKTMAAVLDEWGMLGILFGELIVALEEAIGLSELVEAVARGLSVEREEPGGRTKEGRVVGARLVERDRDGVTVDVGVMDK